jgi:hypothetical protein
VLSPELLDQHIEECQKLIESGEENQSSLDFLLDLKKDLANASEDDWKAYNKLSDHLPKDDEDITLIILKGQLLLEKLVREFIDSRLTNPEAIEKQQFSAAQCISLAESMCLKTDEVKWICAQIRELNTIRNKLAHFLPDDKIEKRISNFVSTVSNAQNLKTKSLNIVISRLYGMLMGLCQLSNSDEYRTQKI